MKKTFFACAACISIAVVQGQDERTALAPPAPPMAMVAPAPPPPPQVPDVADFPPIPVPPAPPAVAAPDVFSDYISPVIINEQGNEMAVKNLNGTTFVVIKKDGKTQKIKLSTWNANRKYYEKKYGQLPPPPPPPAPPLPAVPVKEHSDI